MYEEMIKNGLREIDQKFDDNVDPNKEPLGRFLTLFMTEFRWRRGGNQARDQWGK